MRPFHLIGLAAALSMAAAPAFAQSQKAVNPAAKLSLTSSADDSSGGGSGGSASKKKYYIIGGVAVVAVVIAAVELSHHDNKSASY
jgi:hypothetical protein